MPPTTAKRYRDRDALFAHARECLDALVSERLEGDEREQLAQVLEARRERLGPSDVELLLRAIEMLRSGHGPLSELLADPSVGDIAVNRHDEIWAQRPEGWVLVPGATFGSDEELLETVRRMLARSGSAQSLDKTNPVIDARLPNGGPRLWAVIPPVSAHPMLTLRKFRRQRFTLADLASGPTPMMDSDMARLLERCVEGHLNIIVTGGTGTGKTTLLSALLGCVPTTERVVLIEDTPEIDFPDPDGRQLPHNVSPLIADRNDPKQTPDEMLRAALRASPDRIIVGECRGGEAFTMLQAMNTGHDGSMSTLHANSPLDAVARLEALVLLSGTDLRYEAIKGQIGSAIHLVVQLHRRNGRRWVSEIAEIAWDGTALAVRPILVRRDLDGAVECVSEPTFWDHLQSQAPR